MYSQLLAHLLRIFSMYAIFIVVLCVYVVKVPYCVITHGLTQHATIAIMCFIMSTFVISVKFCYLLWKFWFRYVLKKRQGIL